MAKALLSVPSFTAGELSPRMEGRTDFNKYFSAGTIINNFVVQPHGPVTRRPGSHFISEVKNSAHNTRLIPFSFSTTQTYILEFGNQYIRFYKDSGQIISSGAAYEISSPYLHTEVFDIKFAQSADTMYICHPNHPTRKLTRTGHTNWNLAAVSFTQSSTTHRLSGANNYPKCVSFFEQRLVFAGTNNNPQSLWFSKSGDYENFTTGTADADAMIYTIASNQVNAIESIKSTRTLIVMTTGGEFTVSSGASDSPVTPTNLNIRKQSNYGSAGVDGLSIGNTTVFLQRAKRKVRELAYNFDADGYLAPDLTILSEHITASGIIQMDYQQEPFSVVWCVREDGKLVGMTYNRLQDVVAWHAHEFGGTNAKCKSVAVIDIDTSEDQVYVIVERTINGATKKYVEYLTPYDFNSSLTTFHYVDSGLGYSGSSTTTLSGLSHLEGETVKVILEGATHPDRVVSGGQISLDRSTTNATRS